MNKDEQLKIYSAYLPYQTKCYCMGEQDEDGKPIMFEINGFTHDLVEVLECNTTNITHFDYDEIFPILYDLSYLTKEIEHEGETFVPIQRLSSEFEMNVIEHCFLEQNAPIKGFDWLRSTSYPVVIKLLSYHFNVFNLPEDQFINKATLTTNK